MQPSYQQLAQGLIADIRAARYAIGERLPSVRHYALAQGVSVSTTTRCYRHLESLGWVQARSKSGMYVADWKALQASRKAQVQAKGLAHRPAVEYDKLVSLQHRMTELYSLTAQPLQWSLHLANAVPDWYPCEALARVGQRVLRSDPQALGIYPVGTGWPAFKQELIRHLALCGVDLQPQDLLITHGSTEALNVALRSVAQPGDAVVVESPVYFGLLQMLENLGFKVLEIPCVPGSGISLEALEYALEHHAGVRAVVASPCFQNPLGSAMSEKDKRRLLRLVEQHDVALIEDDAYGDLAPAQSPDQSRLQPVKAWDRHGRVIYCGSCSKSLAPALRVGWVAGGRYQARIESLKLSSSLVTPLFDQMVLAEFMRSGGLPPHLRKLCTRLSTHVPHAAAAVRRYFPGGTRVDIPAGGWWLWIELPHYMDTMQLLRTSVSQGIAFTPGALFSASNKFAHCLRLNVARPWSRELELGIKHLGVLAHSVAAGGA
jgi:DNA-binding transcriptional MocR family regulator